MRSLELLQLEGAPEHAQRFVDGSSPAANPLFSVYNAHGATNQMPWFEASNGPVREARFVQPNGVADGIEAFANFMRMLAPPTPAAPNASSQHGSTLFSSIGCALCTDREDPPGPLTGGARCRNRPTLTCVPDGMRKRAKPL